MTQLVASQRADLTFKGNKGLSRHEWLRLTPAYSVRLVQETLARWKEHENGSLRMIFDPFSGTGTTPLVAAQAGLEGVAVDINPFLVWLGSTKVQQYSLSDLQQAQDSLVEVIAWARQHLDDSDLWQPNLFKIERWWDVSSLSSLRALRAALDSVEPSPALDLLLVAFCQTLISSSSAAFNHQSMSFKESLQGELWDRELAHMVLSSFDVSARSVIAQAKEPLAGSGHIIHGDSRKAVDSLRGHVDGIITSPPYANRMSYIRELRPYMYWLRYLDVSKDAGELDWKAIGGTWGSATSALTTWQKEVDTPIDDEMSEVCSRIVIEGEGKPGNKLMGKYVSKYFTDTWEHAQCVSEIVRSGGRISYVVGNSTFYGVLVPTEKWYAAFFKAAGFRDVDIRTIRKRNSNKALYEFEVTGIKK